MVAQAEAAEKLVLHVIELVSLDELERLNAGGSGPSPPTGADAMSLVVRVAVEPNTKLVGLLVIQRQEDLRGTDDVPRRCATGTATTPGC